MAIRLKKRIQPGGKKIVGRKKKPGADQREMKTIAVRATKEWADWVEAGAKHCRTDTAKLIDAALEMYLESRGYKDQPPERIP